MKNKFGWSTECKEHIKLKKIATRFLKKKMGFKDNEITYENTITPTAYGRRLRGDVVAVNQNRKVWIECGKLSFFNNDLETIKGLGFSFLHLPYANNHKNYLKLTPYQEGILIKFLGDLK